MSLFTRIKATTSRLALPSIARADIRYISDLEEDAYEHWVFDGTTSAVLTGRINERALTPQSAAPGYDSSGILVSGASGSGLLTDIADQNDLRKTFFCVAKTPFFASGSPAPLFGTHASTSGFMLTDGSGDPSNKQVFVRGSTNALPFSGGSFAPDVWRFFCLSFDGKSGQRTLRLLINSEDYSSIVPNLYSSTSGAFVALGNGYYSAGTAVSTRFAEFGVVDDILTQADMQALYGRAKTRLAARGIAIA